ncbi:MAG TPA: hypothetical protein VMT99_03730 [Candidatus Paceibacterota bacterium]|nr:hypothetical protein [Candidatus Paceibacterota bacterium]
MSGTLTIHDELTIEMLIKAGVLTDTDYKSLPLENGTALIACSDGDRFYDTFLHHAHLQVNQLNRKTRSEPRVHTFAWHGGILACVPDSPVNNHPKAAEVFLDQIRDARRIVKKDIDVFAPHSHFPCTAAANADLDIPKILALHARGKEELMNLGLSLKVPCYFHVDYQRNKKRTYQINWDRWNIWSREQMTLVAA